MEDSLTQKEGGEGEVVDNFFIFKKVVDNYLLWKKDNLLKFIFLK